MELFVQDCMRIVTVARKVANVCVYCFELLLVEVMHMNGLHLTGLDCSKTLAEMIFFLSLLEPLLIRMVSGIFKNTSQHSRGIFVTPITVEIVSGPLISMSL